MRRLIRVDFPAPVGPNDSNLTTRWDINRQILNQDLFSIVTKRNMFKGNSSLDLVAVQFFKTSFCNPLDFLEQHKHVLHKLRHFATRLRLMKYR